MKIHDNKDLVTPYYKLLLIFIFFFIVELRWLLELGGISVPNPYIILTILSFAYLSLGSCFLLTTCDKHNMRLPVFYVTLLLIAVCVVICLVNLTTLSAFVDFNTTTEIGVWILNITLFFIAADSNVWKWVHRNKKIVLLFGLLYVILPLCALFLLENPAEVNYNLRRLFYLLDISKDESHGVSYQSYGDKVAFLSFVTFSLLNKQKLFRMLCIFMTLASLYVVGSKASLVGFIFALLAYYVIEYFQKKHYKLLLTFALTSGLMLFFIMFFVVGNTELQSSENWIVQAFAEGQDDVSMQSRKEIYQENIRTMQSRFILGDYKFDTKLGRSGSYTHNYLTLIDYYGFPIFFIYISLWAYFLYKIIRNKNAEDSCLRNSALLMLLFYSLLFVIARTPTSYLFYFTLGSAVVALEEKYQKSTHVNKSLA